MKLIGKIVDIRRHGREKAIDLSWRASDGSVLRDDGATDIADQINMPLDADNDAIEAAIAQKREYLEEVLEQPGIGITLDEPPIVINDLIGKEYQ